MKRIIFTSVFVSVINALLWRHTLLTTVVSIIGYAIGMLIAEKLVAPGFDKILNLFKR